MRLKNGSIGWLDEVESSEGSEKSQRGSVGIDRFQGKKNVSDKFRFQWITQFFIAKADEANLVEVWVVGRWTERS